MTGRNTSGVKLIKIDVDSNISVAGIAKVREEIRMTGENGEEPVESVDEASEETPDDIKKLIDAAEKDAEEDDK